jgi:hypothetical protein
MKMEQTGCSEMLAYKIQTLGNYPEKNIQHNDKNQKDKVQPVIYHEGTEGE